MGAQYSIYGSRLVLVLVLVLIFQCFGVTGLIGKIGVLSVPYTTIYLTTLTYILYVSLVERAAAYPFPRPTLFTRRGVDVRDTVLT